MKKLLYLIPILLFFVAGACTSSKELQVSKTEKDAFNKALIENAIESERYIVKVNKHFGRQAFSIEVNPSTNFIVISHDKVRVNLAYVGRSYEINPIAGINFSGLLVDKSVKTRNNGKVEIRMKVKKDNDIFTIKLAVAKNGQCDLSVGHPRIDYSRYRGQIYKLEGAVSEAVR